MPNLVHAVKTKGGFIDFNVYPYMTDVSGDNTITINAAANLGNRLSYFSLTNFANQSDRSELSDTTSFYTEHNIRWQVSESSPFDLTWQSNFRTGTNNDRHRLGVRWRFNDTDSLSSFFKRINLKYAINLHAIQFDHRSESVWQLEHSFFMKFPYISNRLYLAGFIDHTFNENLPASIPSNPIVGEAQFGFQLIDDLYLIAEYRVNQYRRSDVNNLALGIQYKFLW
ncbi:hypothetical protein ACUR5C_11220 [Aliikangiella sp. IMCC44653]